MFPDLTQNERQDLYNDLWGTTLFTFLVFLWRSDFTYFLNLSSWNSLLYTCMADSFIYFKTLLTYLMRTTWTNLLKVAVPLIHPWFILLQRLKSNHLLTCINTLHIDSVYCLTPTMMTGIIICCCGFCFFVFLKATISYTK